jgi:NADH-quinone oxidoreductase subunit A
MQQPYLGTIALYALLAVAMPGGIVLLVNFLTTKLRTSRTGRKPAAAAETYESGMVPIGDAWVRYHVQYYMYALVFVIFDVEVVFLYPWAVVFRAIGGYALVEIGIFIGILLVGLAYAWRRGALRWE